MMKNAPELPIGVLGMPMRVIVCVAGSEVDRWQRVACGAFDVIKATTWPEALAEARIDVGFVFFHLAERLGLRSSGEQSTIHENPGSAGPRRLVTSPRLPSTVTHDPEATIKRHVLEALAATAADDEGHARAEAITTVGFLGSDLGGHSDLSIAERARAVVEAISEYHALLD